MMLVIAQLIEDIKHDQQADSQACRQAEDVDGGEQLVAGQVPESYLQIVLKHDLQLCLSGKS
jgi:hypothetical protein